MQRLSKKLAFTGALAALLWAIPVSIDFVRPSATAPSLSQAIGVGLKIDTAEARVGRPATPRSVAGVARRTERRTTAIGVGVARPVVAGAAVVGTAAATGAAVAAGTAAGCRTVVVRGVAVRRCGAIVY